jgi:hypothetical protein
MAKFTQFIACCMALLCCTTMLQAQVTGAVYRDYNNNGSRQTTNPIEPLANGVIVNAYNSSDALVATATTSGATAPNYSLTLPAGAYRLEFVFPNTYVNTGDGAVGTGSASSVRFITVPGSGTLANQNYGVFNKNEFFNDNPDVIVPVYQHYSAAGTEQMMRMFPYNNASDPDGNINLTFTTTTPPPNTNRPVPTDIATKSEIGAIYGESWSAATKKLYLGAYLRKKVAFGPNGPGAIYVYNNPVSLTASPRPSLFVDLNAVFTGNPAGAPIVPTRPVNGFDNDSTVIPLIGKYSLGDIELNNNDDTLYAINLNDRQLYAIPTSGALTNTTIKRYNFISGITSLTGVTGFVNSNIRPFGLGVNPRNNNIYIGGVYSGETDANSDNIRMLVWEFNPASGSSTLILNEPLDFLRVINATRTLSFRNWYTVPSQFPVGPLGFNFMPMLSDIVFDGDAMVLGFRDRFGDATPGYNQNLSTSPRSFGDILRVHKSGGTWILENNARSADGNTGQAITSNTLGRTTGPGGEEFYFEDNPGDAGFEASQGSLLIIPGKGGVMSTAFDPVYQNSNGVRIININTAGVQIHSNSAGDLVGAYDIVLDSERTDDGMFFGKTNGMGDIEALMNAPTIELGNRVWNDTNGNGIQDANESPMANISLELFEDFDNDGTPDGPSIGSVTTDAEGNYIFSSNTGTDALGVDYGVNIQPNKGYIIRVAAADWTSGAGAGDLTGYKITAANVNGNGAVDISDNDAALSGNSIPQITVTTKAFGENNHNLDFGFKQTSVVGNKVWRDDDKDGIQDVGEPGVAGVTVTLFRTGGLDGNPATTADNNIPYATTTTDSYGNYLFEDLPAGSYEVAFTLPANYTFTTQTNTTDNTVFTGGSTAANGSDANTTTGKTGTIVLTAGENNRDVDAGIIFNVPSKQSLGDRVWLDADKNGRQDSGENGIAGVTVSLYRATGPDGIAGNADDALPYLITLTDANGNYLFDNIPVGTYEVGFTAPVGYIGSPQTNSVDNGTLTGGSTVANGSDANTISGRTGNIVISANENNKDVDAGFYPQDVNNGSLGNLVWYDVDEDGIQDAGEPGIAGVVVELLDGSNNPIYVNAAGTIVPMGTAGAVAYTTITNASGKYQFNNLPANTPYKIKFNPPAGYTLSPTTGTINDYANSDAGNGGSNISQQVILAPGQHNPAIDAGMYQAGANTKGRIGDKVWFDNDKDGIADSDEAGVSGVTVRLYTNGADGIPGNADDVLVSSTVTDADGKYLFVNVGNGSYNVEFTNIPSGYSFTKQAASGSTGTTDSDVNPLTGRTVSSSFTVSGATVIDFIDAGIIPGVPSGFGSLGNRVWYDIDADGVQDSDELGVQGVTVNLYKDVNGNGIIDAAEMSTPFATTTTNALGEYIFSGLDKGVYQVNFSNLPAGYTASPKDATANGGNDTNDSDGNTISANASSTDVISLAQGEDKLTVDLGIIPPANTNRLSGTVWFDSDGDGSQTNNNTSERVFGVTVTLYNSLGLAVGTTVTDSLGNYQFIGMPDGDYSVGFSSYPAGYTPTTKSTTNNTTGSDVDMATNRTTTVTFNMSNRTNSTLDAGLVTNRATLGNYVWLDEDSDGIQDANETGIPGVTVTLYRPGFGLDGIAGNADDNLPVSSTVTDGGGKYNFSNIEPGTYEVGFSTAPGGLIFTKQNTAGDNQNNTNSDAVPVTGNPTMARTGSIVLTAGEVENTIDAGLTRYTASVGNYVWVDLPGGTTNVQDPSEPGVGGVLVTLKDSGGNVIGTAITDADGKYLISNVPPGTGYTITFSGIPTGASFVAQNSGSNTTLDSDASATGVTNGFNITAGQFVNNVDAGVIIPYTLALTIQDFTLSKLGNNSYIEFKVAERIASATYFIERSTIGNNNFVSIMQLAGGNSLQFAFEDQTLQKNVVNYYRIKEVLPNGKVNYSYIKSIIINNDNDITVYPVPAVQTLHVACNTAWLNQKAIIKLYSVDGKSLLQKNVQALSSVETIDISNISNGTYSLYVYINGVSAKTAQVIIAR